MKTKTHSDGWFESMMQNTMKTIRFICLALAAVCFIAGFTKPHCFATCAFYSLLAYAIHAGIRNDKKEEDIHA